MQQQEFEALTGKEVSAREYAMIERIYMAAPDVDKEQFCHEWKHRQRYDQSETVCEMVAANKQLTIRAQNLAHDLEQMHSDRDELRAERDALIDAKAQAEERCGREIAAKVNLALALLEAGLDKQAIAILGHAYVISLKCSNDIELTSEDRQYLAETLCNR